MIARALADLTVIVHLLFIAYVVFGALLVRYRRWLLGPHLVAALWAVLVNHSGWGCPLTPLENHWRRIAGMQGYADGFIEHYLLPLLYPKGLSDEIAVYLSIVVVVVNIGMYGWILRHPSRR